MKVNKRIFVEKRNGFQTEANDLVKDLNQNLNLNLNTLRVVLIYDVFEIEENVLEMAKQSVFSENMVDDLIELDLTNKIYLAYETLPGQYDQRADSAMQCIRLLDPSDKCTVTCGKVIIFETEVDLAKVSHYLVNPIENRIKDMSVLKIDRDVDVTPLETYPTFNEYSDEEINNFVNAKGLAMTFEDLKLVQEYFRSEKRNPTETEIRVLDTYWSDHCRHTTFETELTNFTFNSERFNDQIQNAYNRYIELRHLCDRDAKPVTLMDMATINSRYLRRTHKADDVEISDEINACSVFIDVDHNGTIEKWLLQFKNETHNHPTEIEPFGGAATCIGGAIRDPLSGRSYVYQAMRVTGSGDVFTPLDETIPGKLAQRVISKKSAHGNSSYGNQIGLSTTYVREIYHDNYVAKHLEVGAVVGAVKAEDVVRLKPECGDVVILLGGRTGRDGIGGATGSSKQHTLTSLEKCASEVQKGNAPEERKIQRLFRNPECTKLIKKCNDFGAGGVCVSVGELADGLLIDLDAVRTKYAGLNATEIAISESQERMSVVVRKEDKDAFIELAHKENLEAYQVAVVTDDGYMKMQYHGEIVVSIARSFIDSAGARQKVEVEFTTGANVNPFAEKEVTKDSVLAMLKDRNVACQKGLSEMFDASIGAESVMMPFGGKTQLTPTQVSVEKIPVLDGKTNTCSILAYGFDPYLMEYSCFAGSMYSVLTSMSKTVAAGGKLKDTYFSFQEYFKRMHKDPKRWGCVAESLLGTIHVQDYFEKCAIGGKDSMSGSFNDIDVPNTLLSFACTKANVKDIVTPEFKDVNHVLGVFLPEMDENGYPNLDSYKSLFENVEKHVSNGEVLSSYVVENGGIAECLFKMSFGNQIGFEVNTDLNVLKQYQGAIVVESERSFEDSNYVVLGSTSEKISINGIDFDAKEALDTWMSTFASIYPVYYVENKQDVEAVTYVGTPTMKSTNCVDEVHVVIPVFPGTNCEYDMARAFNDEGAVSDIFVFRNETESDIEESIDEFVNKLSNAQILALPGGFSSGDEPDGSAKFIVNVLKNEKVKAAVTDLRNRDGLIIGICNGFQALIKSGLLPYGEIKDLTSEDSTLAHNDLNRHISCIASTRCASNNSPWLSSNDTGVVYQIAVSHGEGKFVVNEEKLQELIENGQIAFQYCDHDGNVSGSKETNINGSTYAIEGIVSKDGHVLGKMGHSERYVEGVFKNIYGNKKQNIFANGVNYFKKEI